MKQAKKKLIWAELTAQKFQKKITLFFIGPRPINKAFLFFFKKKNWTRENQTGLLNRSNPVRTPCMKRTVSLNRGNYENAPDFFFFLSPPAKNPANLPPPAVAHPETSGSHIFLIRTPFDAIFAPLESSRRDLHVYGYGYS